MHPYLLSLIAGALLGLAAAMLLVFGGRVAGVSGILAGAVQPSSGESTWKAAFVGGLLVGGLAMAAIAPDAFPQGARSLGLMLGAGVLVGFGARLGNGCTSGHGVCGVGRLSPRGIAATATFMLTGAFSVALLRHVL